MKIIRTISVLFALLTPVAAFATPTVDAVGCCPECPDCPCC